MITENATIPKSPRALWAAGAPRRRLLLKVSRSTAPERAAPAGLTLY